MSPPVQTAAQLFLQRSSVIITLLCFVRAFKGHRGTVDESAIRTVELQPSQVPCALKQGMKVKKLEPENYDCF
jgi:hypothetical protein